MKLTLSEIIDPRYEDGMFSAPELVEGMVTPCPGGFKLHFGYSDYAQATRGTALWVGLYTLKHVFKTQTQAEDLMLDICNRGELNLDHWVSYVDPAQPLLL